MFSNPSRIFYNQFKEPTRRKHLAEGVPGGYMGIRADMSFRRVRRLGADGEPGWWADPCAPLFRMGGTRELV